MFDLCVARCGTTQGIYVLLSVAEDFARRSFHRAARFGRRVLLFRICGVLRITGALTQWFYLGS